MQRVKNIDDLQAIALIGYICPAILDSQTAGITGCIQNTHLNRISRARNFYHQQPGATYITQWLEALERDYSHPSIVGWCPLNETWQVITDRLTVLDDVTRGMFLDVTGAQVREGLKGCELKSSLPGSKPTGRREEASKAGHPYRRRMHSRSEN